MIKFTILNKSKLKTLLLVHGLFTSAGYWLPYLQTLKNYRLIILDIDYRTLRDIDQYVSRITGIIEEVAGGGVEAVISHSLGTLIASRLSSDLRQASFEICPVYSATRRNPDDFVGEIEHKIKFSMSIQEIRDFLADVDCVLASHSTPAQATKGRLIYLPDMDRYFSYDTSQKFMEFRGDHFNIADAVTDIGGEWRCC
jgi:pimeloyl-ACP methyl ester carboxylesterase